MVKYKKAFTLAEVLITLGIIGIVAAMTLPTLYGNIQKKSTVAKLQKAYSTLANAIKLANQESGGLLVTGEDTSAKRFEQYMLPHLKANSKVSHPNLVWYQSNGNREVGYAIVRGKSVEYKLDSGISLHLHGNDIVGNSNPKLKVFNIFMDLNGYDNSPNRLGRDIFILDAISGEEECYITFANGDDGEDEELRKARTRDKLLNGPSAQAYQCKVRGGWCGALIQKDGWKISKDYPW